MSVFAKEKPLDYDANATSLGWNLVGKLFFACEDADGEVKKTMAAFTLE